MSQEVAETFDLVAEMFSPEIENRRERVLPSGHVFACGGRVTGHCETYQEMIFSADRKSIVGPVYPANYQTVTVGELVAWCDREIDRYKQCVALVESIRGPLNQLEPTERL